MTKLALKADNEINLTVRHKAFAFQIEAVEAIKDHDYAAVFHEQGLGKTKIAIDVLLHWLASELVDSILIVTKKGLVPNWQRELRAHTHIKPRLLNQDRSANFAALNSPARIYLTHYEVLNSENNRLQLFQKTRRVGIILDESQKIKNPTAKLTVSAFKLAEGFSKKLILTGTPIANRPYDMWAQIYFLDLGNSLGEDFDKFKNDLDLDSSLADNEERRRVFEKSLASLFARISQFCVRETKDNTNISLPEKVIINEHCEWETIQEEMYKKVRDDMRSIVVRDGIPEEDNSEALLKRLLRLVQIASNPRIIDESYKGTPGKFLTLLELIEDISSNNEKAIVWTTFTDNADWLTHELRSFGSLKIHGKMAYDDRNRSIENFLEKPEKKILVATPGAAKEGLTLTVANHVIFFDRSFSLDDYLQSQDRIHRISQERTCYVHNLVLENSIDQWIDVLLKAKHLAAKLGQGDITEEEYKSAAQYDYPFVLSQILGIEEV